VRSIARLVLKGCGIGRRAPWASSGFANLFIAWVMLLKTVFVCVYVYVSFTLPARCVGAACC